MRLVLIKQQRVQLHVLLAQLGSTSQLLDQACVLFVLVVNIQRQLHAQHALRCNICSLYHDLGHLIYFLQHLVFFLHRIFNRVIIAHLALVKLLARLVLIAQLAHLHQSCVFLVNTPVLFKQCALLAQLELTNLQLGRHRALLVQSGLRNQLQGQLRARFVQVASIVLQRLNQLVLHVLLGLIKQTLVQHHVARVLLVSIRTLDQALAAIVLVVNTM